MDKLLTIQQKLHAPKNQRNNFGKYNYRSCEDILEAVKPLLAETGTTLRIHDEIIERGGWVFVEAHAELYDGSECIAQGQAAARHEPDKKGMDGSQISGAASSYARKYALNGLFLIDDARDSDATNVHDDGKVIKSQMVIDAADGQVIASARKAAGLDTETVADMMREAPFSCQNPPHDLLKKHVPTLVERIETKAKESIT